MSDRLLKKGNPTHKKRGISRFNADKAVKMANELGFLALNISFLTPF